MNGLPENLYLFVDPEAGELCIKDAQEIEWVLFRRGGNGDPVKWPVSVVLSTCHGLKVTEAYTVDGDAVDLDEAINLWFTRAGVEDGFLP